MMHIMLEYYDTELIVPYTTKNITNLKSSLNRNATKEGDLIETVAYFKEMQKTDPHFFYKSTQGSEGFNVVLKHYVNPHNFVMSFVKQYEKIHTYVLVREGGNDYKTHHLQAEIWSNYSIEKEAYIAYTRDIYEKFRTDFELIGKYNVRPHGTHIYELYPYREDWVANYGPRSYFVTIEVYAEEYKYEIPGKYILRRWTQHSIAGATPTVHAEPDEMPVASKKQLRHTNLSMDLASLARVASGSHATAAILKKHMRAACTKHNHFNKTKKKKAKSMKGDLLHVVGLMIRLSNLLAISPEILLDPTSPSL
ncbi:hypothetical protein D1007_14676 [Hordeum vulgare]|nr:hypothetical protein D1007_14676 [Hordeum vulgare]